MEWWNQEERISFSPVVIFAGKIVSLHSRHFKHPSSFLGKLFLSSTDCRIRTRDRKTSSDIHLCLQFSGQTSCFHRTNEHYILRNCFSPWWLINQSLSNISPIVRASDNFPQNAVQEAKRMFALSIVCHHFHDPNVLRNVCTDSRAFLDEELFKGKVKLNIDKHFLLRSVIRTDEF